MTWQGDRAWATTLVVSMLLCAAVFAIWASLGMHVRWIADDFCTLAIQRATGFWEMQAQLRAGWSGRFSFFFVNALINRGGLEVISLLPAFLLVGLTLTAAFFLRSFSFLQMSRWTAGSVAAMLILGTFHALPARGEVLHWATGSVTYTLPLILSLVLFGLLARERAPFVAGVLALLTAGFSETQVAFQASALTCITVVRVGGRQRSARSPALAAAWAGTLLGALLVAIAPGNAARATLLAGSGSWDVSATLFHAVAAPAYFSLRLWSSVAGIAIFFAGLAHGVRQTPSDAVSWRAMVTGGVLAAIIVSGTALPAAIAYGGFPPERARVGAGAFLLTVTFLLGRQAGAMLSPRMRRPRLVATGSLLLSLALPIQSAAMSVSLFPAYRAWAEEWDRREERLRRACQEGGTRVTYAPFSQQPIMDEMPNASPDYWVNDCMAAYYGLTQVAADVDVRPLTPLDRNAPFPRASCQP